MKRRPPAVPMLHLQVPDSVSTHRPARALVDAHSECKRLFQGGVPPAPLVLSDTARLTRRFQVPSFAGFKNPSSEHLLVCHAAGSTHKRQKIDGRCHAVTATPGTVGISPAGLGDWRSSSDPVEAIHLYLAPDRLQAHADELIPGGRYELMSVLSVTDDALASFTSLLEAEVAAGKPLARLFIDQVIELVSLQLVRSHAHVSRPCRPIPRGGLAPWHVARVKEYIRESLDRDISLQELADLVGLSRSHFCTAFRSATGSSPHAWLKSERVQRAQELLADPSTPIMDVALAVGYQTPAAFAATFRKAAGMSPTAFRRRHLSRLVSVL